MSLLRISGFTQKTCNKKRKNLFPLANNENLNYYLTELKKNRHSVCSRSYKTCFLHYQRISPFFAAKLSHFIANDFFYM